MREFPLLPFLLPRRNGLLSSEIHSQTDRAWIFNMLFVEFKKMENGSLAPIACQKNAVILSYLTEVLKYSCICFSCQIWPYWFLMRFQEKEIMSSSWETLVLTKVSGSIYFIQFRMQLFVPEAFRSAETDNSKTFLEKIELTVYEIGYRPVLEYSHLGWNPSRLFLNHSFDLLR